MFYQICHGWRTNSQLSMDPHVVSCLPSLNISCWSHMSDWHQNIISCHLGRLESGWPTCQIGPHVSLSLWQNHLWNEGFVFQDYIGGFLRKRECTNTTHKHTIPWYLSWKIVITVSVPCIRFTKDETKRVLQKIEQSFAEAIFSHVKHTLFTLEESELP
jgi:hypothetical protein